MPDKDMIWSNPTLGTRTYFDHDETTDEIVLNTVQDVEPALERNKIDFPRLTDVDTRLADMDRLGIDIQVISPSPGLVGYRLVIG